MASALAALAFSFREVWRGQSARGTTTMMLDRKTGRSDRAEMDVQEGLAIYPRLLERGT